MEANKEQACNNAFIQKKMEQRKLAEKQIKGQEANVREAFGLSVNEISRLIHELRVHQIELEMQNEELRQHQDEIEASRRKYVQLYDFAPIGYFTLGEKSMILEANLTGAALVGVERDALIGKPLTHFIFPEDQDTFYLHSIKVFDTQEQQSCKIRMKKADGTLFHASLQTRMTPDEKGPKVCRTAISDVTKQVEMEAQLRQTHKLEAMGTLAGGIAHEFNNILFPIVGYAQMTMEDMPQGSEPWNNLESILRGARRAAGLVRQILDFSRLDVKDIRMPVEVRATIKDTLRLIRASLPSTIDIRQDIDREVGEIMGDPIQISQVVMNLCTNAFHAMEDEGGILEVRLSQTEIGPDDAADMDLSPGHHLWLSVRDTGHGIRPETMERIFEPYFTTKPVGKGTGMGLAMAYGIVRGHGGAIRVRSHPGQGSAFDVYLPMMGDHPPVEYDQARPSEPLPIGNEHILFVDDEEDVVLLVQKMLERLGYPVTATTCAMDALEIFSAQPEMFDLVITDLSMPDLPGDKLAKKLMTIRPDIPVILCSGFDRERMKEKTRAAGARKFLTKPISLEKMADTIRQVLG